MYIIGDWGTTNFRLYLISDDKILDTKNSLGVGQLKISPKDCLFETIKPWLDKYTIDKIILGGMAGSKIGIYDMPYLNCPISMNNWKRWSQEIELNGYKIQITAGVTCLNFANTTDVMRGEEVQIFGAMKINKALKNGMQAFVLPGTHSKWAVIENGQIENFHTFPTGELFQIISENSTLISNTKITSQSDYDIGFEEGLKKSKGGKFLANIFQSRSQTLISDKSSDWSYGFLSGLMIGSEVHDAKQYLHGKIRDIIIIGSTKLESLYEHALNYYGYTTNIINGDDCAIVGLKFASGNINKAEI